MAGLVFSGVVAIVNYQRDQKATVSVDEIHNITPEKYYGIKHLNKIDSMLYKRYLYEGDNKWKEKFKNVIKINKDIKWHQWGSYMDAHGKDGVDAGINKLIFSNDSPDQKFFIIQQ